jgi:hypothetical protein
MAGYPIAGSAPLPAPSRITLDEPDADTAFWPAENSARATADTDPPAAGSSPGERTDALQGYPPAWPPTDGPATGGGDSDQPVTIDLAGRVTGSGEPSDAHAESQAGHDTREPGPDTDRDDRDEPGADTTAILELPPGHTPGDSPT